MPKFILDANSTSFQSLEIDGSGVGVVKTTENIDPVLDANKRKMAQSSKSWAGDMHHVATVPASVVTAWSKELGDDPLAKRNHKWLMARLNNSEWSGLRVKGGRL